MDVKNLCDSMVGRHLMIDGRVHKPHNLNCAETGSKLLEDIVLKIDMTMILPPLTVKFPHALSELDRIVGALEKEGLANSQTAQQIREHLKQRKLQTYGYSSMVMIAESHLSIHTFPEEDFFTFDCYSCKDFEAEQVIEVLHTYFPKANFNVQNVTRHVPSYK